MGLVGLPNVGKSTILSILTHARPKIANYHFTTLEPNLGVVDMGAGRSYIMADIPGLIEGASQGAGLGHDFLRHIERTRALAHVLDMSGSEGRDPIEDFDLIQEELLEYHPELPKRLRVIVANKMDLPGAAENLERFRHEMTKRGVTLVTPTERKEEAILHPWKEPQEQEAALTLLPVSAATTEGLEALRYELWKAVSSVEKTNLTFDEDIVDVEQFYRRDTAVTVTRKGHRITVSGEPVANLAKKLIINDGASVQFFERSLEQMGIMDRVRALDPTEDDVIDIEGFEFDWL